MNQIPWGVFFKTARHGTAFSEGASTTLADFGVGSLVCVECHIYSSKQDLPEVSVHGTWCPLWCPSGPATALCKCRERWHPPPHLQFHFIFVCELAIFSNIYHITMIFVDENFFSRLCTSRNMGDGCHEGKGTKKSPMLSLRKAGLCFFQGFTYSISQPCQKTMDHDQKNAGPKQTKILQDPVVQDGLILEDRLNEAKWLGFFRL